MNFSEIRQLLDAGFTRDDILTLAGAAPEQTPAPEQTTAPEQTPALEQTPAPEQTPAAGAADEAIKALTASVAALSKTVTEMQLANAKNAQSGKVEPMTADDVIKSFFAR